MSSPEMFSQEIQLDNGIKAVDIFLSVEGQRVTVEPKNKKLGQCKMITLPPNVDEEQVTCTISGGILKIKAPFKPPLYSGQNWNDPDPRLLAMELHNELRRKHGVPPLELSDELSDEAQGYTDSLIQGKKGHHGEGLGRNVYHHRSTGTGKSIVEGVREAVKTWYGHQNAYNWKEPLTSPEYVNLFSQVIWKASQFIGVGLANKNGVTIVTCLYVPAGNVVSEERYKENVLKCIR